MEGIKLKVFLKAFGFTLLIGLIYVIISGIVGAVIGVILAIKNAGILNNRPIPDMLAYNEAIMSGMGRYMLPMIIAINLITLGVIVLIFLARRQNFLTYVNFKKISVKDGLNIFAFGIFLNLFFVALLNFAAMFLPIDAQMNKYAEVMEPMLNGNIILIIIAVVIVAPIFEEIVLRGIVFNDFKKAVPVWLALVIQGLVFGIMHMNLIQGTYAFFLGVMLGILYLYYKSIWIPILMHLSFNLTSTVLSGIFPEDSSNLFYSLLGVLGLIGVTAIGYVMYKTYDAEAYKTITLEENITLIPDEEIDSFTITQE
jgi:membrane protease YdiL (CAAX protease family)